MAARYLTIVSLRYLCQEKHQTVLDCDVVMRTTTLLIRVDDVRSPIFISHLLREWLGFLLLCVLSCPFCYPLNQNPSSTTRYDHYRGII
jgi:hypothetical protein